MPLAIRARTVWKLLRDTVREFISDGVMAHAAAVSFYGMLSLAPLLVIVVAIVGAVWGEEAARGEIVGQFSGLMGRDAAATVEGIIERSSDQPKRGRAASLIGIGVLLFAALGVFEQLKSALNTVWDVKPRTGAGVWSLIRSRLLSFAMVLVIAFLLVVSLVVSALLAAVGDWLAARMPGVPALLYLVNTLTTPIAFTVLFAAMYKVLPDARIAWRDVWTGAAITAILFTIGKSLIAMYLGGSRTVTMFGAAGSLAFILLWVYYSATILLAGAEFTQVYSRWRGQPIVPAKHAVRADACPGAIKDAGRPPRGQVQPA